MNILTQSGQPKGIADVDQLRAHAAAVIAGLDNFEATHLANLMLNIGEHPESARALRAGELVALAAFAQVGFRVDPQDARDAEKGT